jgi:2-methylcitrate dehydratase PrpD
LTSSRLAGEREHAVSERTARLAEYIAEGLGARLPAEVLDAASAHVLDTVAAMVSGSRLVPGRRGAAYVAEQGSRGDATVVGTDQRASAVDAALANGMSAHADETDDSHPESLSHPGCAIVPAALAVAQRLGRTGGDLLRAVVAGYDVGPRVVLALGRPPALAETSSYSTHAYAGLFGAAAAASVLHGLDEPAARHALSYAAQSAAGVTSWLRDPNHVEKAFVFGGMPAANGVRAAGLVASGCDGVADVFTGHPNFLAAIGPGVRPELLTDGLSERYEVTRTNIKKFAVGSPAQAAVQATLDLVAEHDPAPTEVTGIEIVLPGDLAKVVDGRDMPDINVQYLVAGTLLDRRFSFAMAHDTARMHHPEARALMERTRVVADPEVSGVRCATVIFSMADGRALRRHVAVVRGTVDDPMSLTELVEKSRDLLVPVLGADRSDRLTRTLPRLAELPDLHVLGELLAA